MRTQYKVKWVVNKERKFIMPEELIDINEAVALEEKEVINMYRKNINPQLIKMFSMLNFDRCYVRAQGCSLFDEDGEEYLDFLGGYGALNFGHNPREIIEAVNKVEEFPDIMQAAPGKIEAAAAQNLARISPGDLSRVFFTNSGTESVEGAIKLARAASDSNKIIYCDGSFHGKTMGSLSITGREKYRKPFEPLLSETEVVSFGACEALEKKFSEDKVAAFILEPIQGEGGIIVPPEGYLKQVRQLCNKYGVYFIIDEIQTGLGRTGYNFACEREEVVPDILCLAKSLGGGVVPAGAVVTRRKIWDKAYGSMEKALLHTSTFGGNTRASAAVLQSLYILQNEKLSEKVREKGEYFLSGLKKITSEYNLIEEVRGRGLMAGVEFKCPERNFLDRISGGLVKKYSGRYLGSIVAGILLNDYGIITAYTLNNPLVIRLEPPLIVTYEEMDCVLQAFSEIISNKSGMLDFALSGFRNMASKR